MRVGFNIIKGESMAIDPKKLRNFAGVAPAPLKRVKVQPPEDDDDMDYGDDDGDGEEMSIEEMIEAAVAALEAGEMDVELEATEGYDPEADGNPPAWVEDEEIWERAKAAVEDKWDEMESPWAVVAFIYQKMHGKIAE